MGVALAWGGGGGAVPEEHCHCPDMGSNVPACCWLSNNCDTTQALMFLLMSVGFDTAPSQGRAMSVIPDDLFSSFMGNGSNQSEYRQLSKAVTELLCRDSQTKGLVFNLLNSKHEGRVLSVWAKLKREMVDRFSS